MLASRNVIVIHTAVLGLAVALFVYFVVPRFVPVLTPLGNQLPVQTQWLLSSYPWAFLVPVVGIVGVLLVPRASKRLWFAVPVGYLVACLVVVFTFWALYSPMYALADGK